MNPFTNPLDPDNSKAKDILKNWLSAKLKLTANARIDITEFQCADPGCLHSETIFYVSDSPTPAMTLSKPLPENTQVYKIAKPMVFIRKWDIDAISLTTVNRPAHKH